MKQLVLIIGAIALIVVVYFGLRYFGLYGMKPMASSAPSNLVVPANSVIIQGNAFNPDTLTVKVGTTVTWTNNDSYDHTVTSDTGVFDSGHVSSGQSYTYTFAKTGTFPYHCSIHTFMTAKVVVTN